MESYATELIVYLFSLCLGTAILAGLAFLYFLPTYLARKQKHPRWLPILVINLAFGWTFVGWIGALVWAVTLPLQPKPEIYHQPPPIPHRPELKVV